MKADEGMPSPRRSRNKGGKAARQSRDEIAPDDRLEHRAAFRIWPSSALKYSRCDIRGCRLPVRRNSPPLDKGEQVVIAGLRVGGQ